MFSTKIIIEEELQQWIHEHNYKSQVIPKPQNESLIVHFNISFLSFSIINEEKSHISFVLQLKWDDNRLKFSDRFENVKRVKLNPEWNQKLWIPELSVINANNIKIAKLLLPYVYLYFERNQTLLYIMRLEAEIYCEQKLRIYADQEYICGITFESIFHNVRELIFQWEVGNFTDNVHGTRLKVSSLTLEKCAEKKFDPLQVTKPCLLAKIGYYRNINVFIVTKYIPSGMAVLIAIGSLFIPIAALTARFTTITASFIVLIVVYFNTPMSYTFSSSINIWMFACCVFIFATLIEYLFAIKEYGTQPKDIKADDLGIFAYQDKHSELVAFSGIAIDLICALSTVTIKSSKVYKMCKFIYTNPVMKKRF
ncbi:Glycine receptor subunit alphaZ1-like protein [Dinothrombium tinctorium]|uniref:Glycine receptor subunit alphaZ1-like protein n=1 Tax=Dinothrombium tinctorium TaxID=1965070 RepID=A0A3S3P5R9_9ACAR|nr:Glycine receptor subunit alphaZ1-like protein [Dinothrombium tinctorium]RWS12738.1 Glycine receptor subunit alphaZ1-like protein [Dinothrombium tinctorium]RWS13311.1 Glycine receptor subunit alphaZ1-like protein [Dinothrombium tinctorium]